MPRPEHHPHDSASRRRAGPGSLGTLLTELRLARGWSQLRVAEQLCAASGVPTVSRHEVSRWERQQRVPGKFWLNWLAAVLEVPVEELAVAAAASRPTTAGGGEGRDGGNPGVVRARQELLTSAHAWLTDPDGPVGPTITIPVEPIRATSVEPTGVVSVEPIRAVSGGPAWMDSGRSGRAGEQAPELPLDAAGVAGVRRLDDLVGGEDLLSSPAGRLTLTTARCATGRPGRQALPLVAEAAQLVGWLHTDAGKVGAALRAYRLALAAAAGAGDRSLGAHILGSASHLLSAFGDARGGLLLARTGYLGARRTAPAGLRALLLHRIAFGAARCGRHRPAYAALRAAERAAGRREPPREPAWLYWLDEGEFAAMTGRCLASLRRPLRAEPLLRAALTRPGQPRTAAVYGAWLARAYLDLGEWERAAEVADGALLDTVRSGSARAAAELAGVGRRLAAYRTEPAGRRHAALAAAARRYLPAAPPAALAG
ncbi:helix-turn-helix transcriptional regulator [Plantactinospora sp. KLBMP9567]|uniref:helix-turn-helix transcriptional regulator n=1 Tax=Plantactinospora sp. KLBMP9567 TaxID=3085900 RepID=UPI0029827715|nr:helix-turn-helix transcriptional regulator [Plantactinospora sp. KLBMP9567]MDW5323038.1 helix-turn-helix transcriptional regulator [Plantactinospora sp. KLBMP9567]